MVFKLDTFLTKYEFNFMGLVVAFSNFGNNFLRLGVSFFLANPKSRGA